MIAHNITTKKRQVTPPTYSSAREQEKSWTKLERALWENKQKAKLGLQILFDGAIKIWRFDSSFSQHRGVAQFGSAYDLGS